MQLGEDEPAALLHLEHAQIGDDEINDAEACDGQRAFFQNLRAAVFGRVLHHRNDALHSSDQVHRAARSFHHFSGDHPIGDIAFIRHLEGAENGEIDVAAANHREGIGAREKSGARHRRDRLLPGVDHLIRWQRADLVREILLKARESL